MLEHAVHNVMHFLHHHPHWGSVITFIVAFAESLAVIGTIIPGSVTMTGIGVLVGTTTLPLLNTLFWATIGALCGDYIGYWFGKNYSTEIRNSKWLQGRKHWLEKGEAFFHKHGGKSVIIGRFFGPVRSLIPMIAGLLKMPTLRFTLAVIPAAFLWAVFYLGPGIFLGAISMELPKAIATKFLAYGLIAILATWLITRIVKLFFDQIAFWFDQIMVHLWRKMKSSPKIQWLTRILADPSDPDLHHQLSLFILAIISGLMFCLIFWHVAHHGFLTDLNQPILNLLQSIRTKTLDVIMLAITLIGERYVIAAFACSILAYFIWEKDYRAAIHWAVLMVVGVGITYGIKLSFYNARPNANLKDVVTSSFPSGHTTLSTIFYGFMAVLISHDLPERLKRLPYRAVMITVSMIILSRMYLAAHWLTDTLASVLLGFFIMLIATISYRRHIKKHLCAKKLTAISLLLILLFTTGLGILKFRTYLVDYKPVYPATELTYDQWWNGKNSNDQKIPVVRFNRWGKAQEHLNIQFLGDITTLEKNLEKKQWQQIPANSNIKNLLRRAAKLNGYHLSLIPQLYENNPPALLMIKSRPNAPPMILRLWDTHIIITDRKEPLHLGSINLMKAHLQKETVKQENVNKLLQSYLSDYTCKLINGVLLFKEH